MEYPQSRPTEHGTRLTIHHQKMLSLCAALMHFMYKSIWSAVRHSCANTHTHTQVVKLSDINIITIWESACSLGLCFQLSPQFFPLQKFIRYVAGVTMPCILPKHKISPLKVFHLTDWKITFCGNRENEVTADLWCLWCWFVDVGGGRYAMMVLLMLHHSYDVRQSPVRPSIIHFATRCARAHTHAAEDKSVVRNVTNFQKRWESPTTIRTRTPTTGERKNDNEKNRPKQKWKMTMKRNDDCD